MPKLPTASNTSVCAGEQSVTDDPSHNMAGSALNQSNRLRQKCKTVLRTPSERTVHLTGTTYKKKTKHKDSPQSVKLNTIRSCEVRVLGLGLSTLNKKEQIVQQSEHNHMTDKKVDSKGLHGLINQGTKVIDLQQEANEVKKSPYVKIKYCDKIQTHNEGVVGVNSKYNEFAEEKVHKTEDASGLRGGNFENSTVIDLISKKPDMEKKFIESISPKKKTLNSIDNSQLQTQSIKLIETAQTLPAENNPFTSQLVSSSSNSRTKEYSCISDDDILFELHFGEKCNLNSKESTQHATFITVDKFAELVAALSVQNTSCRNSSSCPSSIQKTPSELCSVKEQQLVLPPDTSPNTKLSDSLLLQDSPLSERLQKNEREKRHRYHQAKNNPDQQSTANTAFNHDENVTFSPLMDLPKYQVAGDMPSCEIAMQHKINFVDAVEKIPESQGSSSINHVAATDSPNSAPCNNSAETCCTEFGTVKNEEKMLHLCLKDQLSVSSPAFQIKEKSSVGKGSVQMTKFYKLPLSDHLKSSMSPNVVIEPLPSSVHQMLFHHKRKTVPIQNDIVLDFCGDNIPDSCATVKNNDATFDSLYTVVNAGLQKVEKIQVKEDCIPLQSEHDLIEKKTALVTALVTHESSLTKSKVTSVVKQPDDLKFSNQISSSLDVMCEAVTLKASEFDCMVINDSLKSDLSPVSISCVLPVPDNRIVSNNAQVIAIVSDQNGPPSASAVPLQTVVCQNSTFPSDLHNVADIDILEDSTQSISSIKNTNSVTADHDLHLSESHNQSSDKFDSDIEPRKANHSSLSGGCQNMNHDTGPLTEQLTVIDSVQESCASNNDMNNYHANNLDSSLTHNSTISPEISRKPMQCEENAVRPLTALDIILRECQKLPNGYEILYNPVNNENGVEYQLTQGDIVGNVCTNSGNVDSSGFAFIMNDPAAYETVPYDSNSTSNTSCVQPFQISDRPCPEFSDKVNAKSYRSKYKKYPRRKKTGQKSNTDMSTTSQSSAVETTSSTLTVANSVRKYEGSHKLPVDANENSSCGFFVDHGGQLVSKCIQKCLESSDVNELNIENAVSYDEENFSENTVSPSLNIDQNLALSSALTNLGGSKKSNLHQTAIHKIATESVCSNASDDGIKDSAVQCRSTTSVESNDCQRNIPCSKTHLLLDNKEEMLNHEVSLEPDIPELNCTALDNCTESVKCCKQKSGEVIAVTPLTMALNNSVNDDAVISSANANVTNSDSLKSNSNLTSTKKIQVCQIPLIQHQSNVRIPNEIPVCISGNMSESRGCSSFGVEVVRAVDICSTKTSGMASKTNGKNSILENVNICTKTNDSMPIISNFHTSENTILKQQSDTVSAVSNETEMLQKSGSCKKRSRHMSVRQHSNAFPLEVLDEDVLISGTISDRIRENGAVKNPSVDVHINVPTNAHPVSPINIKNSHNNDSKGREEPKLDKDAIILLKKTSETNEKPALSNRSMIYLCDSYISDSKFKSLSITVPVRNSERKVVLESKNLEETKSINKSVSIAVDDSLNKIKQMSLPNTDLPNISTKDISLPKTDGQNKALKKDKTYSKKSGKKAVISVKSKPNVITESNVQKLCGTILESVAQKDQLNTSLHVAHIDSLGLSCVGNDKEVQNQTNINENSAKIKRCSPSKEVGVFKKPYDPLNNSLEKSAKNILKLSRKSSKALSSSDVIKSHLPSNCSENVTVGMVSEGHECKLQLSQVLSVQPPKIEKGSVKQSPIEKILSNTFETSDSSCSYVCKSVAGNTETNNGQKKELVPCNISYEIGIAKQNSLCVKESTTAAAAVELQSTGATKSLKSPEKTPGMQIYCSSQEETLSKSSSLPDAFLGNTVKNILSKNSSPPKKSKLKYTVSTSLQSNSAFLSNSKHLETKTYEDTDCLKISSIVSDNNLGQNRSVTVRDDKKQVGCKNVDKNNVSSEEKTELSNNLHRNSYNSVQLKGSTLGLNINSRDGCKSALKHTACDVLKTSSEQLTVTYDSTNSAVIAETVQKEEKCQEKDNNRPLELATEKSSEIGNSPSKESICLESESSGDKIVTDCHKMLLSNVEQQSLQETGKIFAKRRIENKDDLLNDSYLSDVLDFEPEDLDVGFTSDNVNSSFNTVYEDVEKIPSDEFTKTGISQLNVETDYFEQTNCKSASSHQDVTSVENISDCEIANEVGIVQDNMNKKALSSAQQSLSDEVFFSPPLTPICQAESTTDNKEIQICDAGSFLNDNYCLDDLGHDSPTEFDETETEEEMEHSFKRTRITTENKMSEHDTSVHKLAKKEEPVGAPQSFKSAAINTDLKLQLSKPCVSKQIVDDTLNATSSAVKETRLNISESEHELPFGYCWFLLRTGECKRKGCKYRHQPPPLENVEKDPLDKLLAPIREACDSGLLNKAFQDAQVLLKAQSSVIRKEILSILLGAAIKFNTLNILKDIYDFLKSNNLLTSSHCSDFILLCKPKARETFVIVQKLFETCEKRHIAVTSEALSALNDFFCLDRSSWLLTAKLMEYSLSVCNVHSVDLKLLQEILLSVCVLRDFRSETSDLLGPLSSVLYLLDLSQFKNLPSWQLVSFIKLLSNSIQHSGDKTERLKNKYVKCFGTDPVDASNALTNIQAGHSCPNESVNNIPQPPPLSAPLLPLIEKGRWMDVANAFRYAVENGNFTTVTVLHKALNSVPMKMCEKFKCFISALAEDKNSLCDLNMRQSIMVASIGTCLMLEAYTMKQVKAAFEILNTLRWYDIDYVHLLEAAMELGFFSKEEMDKSKFSPLSPYDIALKSVDVCLQCDEQLKAFDIFKEHDWLPAEKWSSEPQAENVISRVKLLLKLCLDLQRTNLCTEATELLNTLLKALDQDVKVQAIPQSLAEAINRCYNKLMAELLNMKNLEQAVDLYYCKRGNNHSALDIYNPVLRAFVIVAMECGCEEKSKEFFMYCILQGVYSIYPFSTSCVKKSAVSIICSYRLNS